MQKAPETCAERIQFESRAKSRRKLDNDATKTLKHGKLEQLAPACEVHKGRDGPAAASTNMGDQEARPASVQRSVASCAALARGSVLPGRGTLQVQQTCRRTLERQRQRAPHRTEHTSLIKGFQDGLHHDG